MNQSLEEILFQLYKSEINASISWMWDGGVDVKLGTEYGGFYAETKVRTFDEAKSWLADKAYEHHPDSGFAKWWGCVRRGVYD